MHCAGTIFDDDIIVIPPAIYATQPARDVIVQIPTVPEEKSFITGSINAAPASIITTPTALQLFLDSSSAVFAPEPLMSRKARMLIAAAAITSSMLYTVLRASLPAA